MPARILDGKILAQEIKHALREEVISLKTKTGKIPHLINILVGEDDGSCAYANSQKRVAEQLGIHYDLVALPPDISQEALIDRIQTYNCDKQVNGVMLHKPLPRQINERKVENVLSIEKDLEGINVTNIGKMLIGQTELIPCTPAAVMEHIRSTRIDLRGKEAVIIGASEIVGKPLSLLLLREMATVTVCHIATSEAGRLKEHVGRAEILVVAVGKPGLIFGDWIQAGAIVIDVGINRLNDKIVGDVDFDSAFKKAGFITPVPGGVGPLTVVMLMRNGILAFKSQNDFGDFN